MIGSFFFNWLRLWSIAKWNAQSQYIGWPITWFTAVRQSNSVNGVVRRFPIHLALKAWRPVSVIWPPHSSGRLFCMWTAVWIKPLSEECALEWKWRYGSLVWWVVQHLTYGADGWAACARGQQPDVLGDGWGWLIENRQETWSSPVIFKAFIWPRWVGWALIHLSEAYSMTLQSCVLWFVTCLLMFNLVGALLTTSAFWPALMELKAKRNWKKRSYSYNIKYAKFRLKPWSHRTQSVSCSKAWGTLHEDHWSWRRLIGYTRSIM